MVSSLRLKHAWTCRNASRAACCSRAHSCCRSPSRALTKSWDLRAGAAPRASIIHVSATALVPASRRFSLQRHRHRSAPGQHARVHGSSPQHQLPVARPSPCQQLVHSAQHRFCFTCQHPWLADVVPKQLARLALQLVCQLRDALGERGGRQRKHRWDAHQLALHPGLRRCAAVAHQGAQLPRHRLQQFGPAARWQLGQWARATVQQSLGRFMPGCCRCIHRPVSLQVQQLGVVSADGRLLLRLCAAAGCGHLQP